jgi:hypothetical protein
MDRRKACKPTALEPLATPAHGNDERISVEGLGQLVEFLYSAIVEIAATK